MTDVAFDSSDMEEWEISEQWKQEDEECHQRRKQKIPQLNATHIVVSTASSGQMRGGEPEVQGRPIYDVQACTPPYWFFKLLF